MSKQDWKDICHQARPVIRRAADFIRMELDRVTDADIEEKGAHDLVSYVDTSAEEMLVEGLGPIIPEATFLTEEGMAITLESDWKWIVDPLDGTTNFLHGLPCFSVSVALEYRGEYVVGIVHEVNRDEQFYAWKDGGAWCNGEPIQVRNEADTHRCLLATGFPYHDFSRLDEYMRLLQSFMRNTRGLRRFGSAAVDLAYVACGRFDGFFEYCLNPWDIAAGAMLVQEAGGVVTDMQGGNKYRDGSEILAAGRALHPTLLRAVKDARG